MSFHLYEGNGWPYCSECDTLSGSELNNFHHKLQLNYIKFNPLTRSQYPEMDSVIRPHTLKKRGTVHIPCHTSEPEQRAVNMNQKDRT
jgi:hypothetical protein